MKFNGSIIFSLFILGAYGLLFLGCSLRSEKVSLAYHNNLAVGALANVQESLKPSLWDKIMSWYFDTELAPQKGIDSNGSEVDEQRVKEFQERLIAVASEEQKHFVQALRYDESSFPVQINLALTQEILGKYPTSIELYKYLDRLKERGPLGEFIINYNLARLFRRLKDIPRALEHYQRALEFSPQSKEVKINIELLMKEQEGKGSGGDSEPKESQEPSEDGSDKDPGDLQNPTKDTQKQNFTKEELQQILNELKEQENKIRERALRGRSKEKPSDKPW